MSRVLVPLIMLTARSCVSTGRPDQNGDAQNIQGTWQVVSSLDQGVKQPPRDNVRVVISAHLFTLVYPNETMGWKYTIDPTKTPKQMDWFPEEEPGHPIHQVAIYSLDGDTLKICSASAGKPRPTKFESKKGIDNRTTCPHPIEPPVVLWRSSVRVNESSTQ